VLALCIAGEPGLDVEDWQKRETLKIVASAFQRELESE